VQEKNAAGSLRVAMSGLWHPSGPGYESGHESPGVWIGRPKRSYGEDRQDVKPVERKALARVKPSSVKQEVNFEPMLVEMSKADGTIE